MQRKRQELVGARHGLVAVLAVAAIFALVGGVRGIGALFVVAGTQVLGAWLVATRHIHGRIVALGAALLAIGWGVAQILIFDGVSWLSLALLGGGLLEAMLVAGSTPRDDGKRKQMRGRP